MKKLLFLILLLSFFSPRLITGQTTIQVIQNSDFSSTGQNFWGPGAPDTIKLDKNFFSTPLLNGGLGFGGITGVAGFDFGAEFNMSAWAQFGAGLNLRLTGAHINVNYESDVRLTMPDSLQFNKGEEVTIDSKLLPDTANSVITYDNYDFLFRLWMYYRLGAKVKGNVCIFDCYPFTLLDFDIHDTVDLISIKENSIDVLNSTVVSGSETNEYLMEGITIEKPEDVAPPPLVLMFSAPVTDSSKDHIYMNGDVLTCKSEPREYANLKLSIPAMIGYLLDPHAGEPNAPPVSPTQKYLSLIFKNLSNSWSWGQFSFSYTVVDANFLLGLYHNMKLEFDPNMMAQMTFPTKVDYEVLKPDNSQRTFGTDSIVNYVVGDKVRFRYPCNFEFMDILSRYSVNDNTIRNHTYDSLSFSFAFKMLAISGGMPEITVIPGYCFDLPYPCPTLTNPVRWCSEEVCIPPVVFHEISFSEGPLVTYTKEFFNYSYDWLDKRWTMPGFSTTESQKFRLKPAKFLANATSTSIPCFGQNTATATVIVTNGVPPYRYEWSNGVVHNNIYSTTDVMPNLGPGTQYVIVTDKNNCTSFADVVVNAPAAPIALNSNLTQVLCNGNNSGAIALSVTGGTAPYTYQWDSGPISQDISGLAAGTYIVTVTDANNCKNTQHYIITQPSPLIAATTNTNADCFGASTGALSVTAAGGITPYTYQWSNGSTSAQVNNVPADNYTVTVTDFNNCQRVLTDTVTQPLAAVSLTYNAGDVLCNGESTGYIDLTLSGGTNPYSIEWYDQNGIALNEHAASVDSIPVGTFTALITDAQGCTLDTTVSIHQPPQINWGYTTVDNLCFGEANGQINLTVGGGMPDYTYSWNNTSTSANLTGLLAGTYTVTITDQNGCKAVASATILEPAAALAASVTPTNILCWGGVNGQADLIANGGTAPYTYLWSTGVTTEDLSSVGAGNYSVTVTDNNNCSAFSGVVITQPADSLDVLATLSPVTCNGLTDGDIFIQVSGGTKPYYLRWDDTDILFNETGHLVEGLGAGVYQVIVTDANGCQYEQSYAITAPDAIQLDATSTLVHCFGGADGSIALSATGGISPYQYLWSNGATSRDLSGLQVGSYIVTVTDANGCFSSLTADVNGMPVINVTGSVVPISCIDNTDGRISIVAEGGAGSYSYLWSNGSVQTLIENLSAGEYSLTVTDAYGCIRDFDLFVPSSELECINIPNSFTPNEDGTNDTWVVRNIYLYPGNSVRIFNRWGKLLYEASPYDPEWDGTYESKPLPAETYYYIINLNNGTAPYTGTVTIVR